MASLRTSLVALGLSVLGAGALFFFLAPQRQAHATVLMPSGASYGDLLAQIQALTSRVAALEAQVATLRGAAYAPYQAPSSNPAVPNAANPSGNVVIDQAGGTYQAGWDIYFTGRGFLPYEQVTISSGGLTRGTATADASGNIRANGIGLGYGSQTFTFTGQASGRMATVTVRGVRSVTQDGVGHSGYGGGYPSYGGGYW